MIAGSVGGVDPREQLSEAGRRFVAAGLVVGSGGNLSARVGDACWVTAAGTRLDELTAAAYSLVRVADGAALDGAPMPSTEVALHLATYRVRPDVQAVIHLHPQTSVLLDALDEPIRLLTTDHAAYVRSVRSVPFHPPGTSALADAAAAACADGTNCLVLRQHGCSVLGPDIALAATRALNLEEAARATYAALLLGRTPPEMAWDSCSRGSAPGGGHPGGGAPWSGGSGGF